MAVPPSLIPQGVNPEANTLEIVDPVFFGVDNLDPTDNTHTILASLPLLNRQQQMIVGQLPHDTDLLQFSIQHLAYVDPRGQTPPRTAAFQPALFTVTVNTSVDQDTASSYFGSFSMSEEVRVKADAQGL